MVDYISIKVSTMTGKLTGIQAVSTSPLDNEFCQRMAGRKGTVCQYCYSCAMLRGLRKNCRPAWKRNGEQLRSRLLRPDEIPVFKTALGRFHPHGELHNVTHARNYLRIARANRHVTWGFWTKRPALVRKAIKAEGLPRNVVLIYSEPRLNVDKPRVPEGFHKTFAVYTEDRKDINCGARSCVACRRCYNRRTASVVREKVK